MKKAFLASAFLILVSVSHAQVANLDFESWADSGGKYRLNNWEHLSYYQGGPCALLGTWVDSNAEHGLYALKLSRWYNYVMDWVRQRAAIASRPGNLSGYYKYIDNILDSPYYNDSGLISVFLTKWNTISLMNDTIGSGNATLAFDSTYTLFNCPVVYTDSRIPDSITIDIKPTYITYNRGFCHDPSGYCSYLTIDNLSLEAPTEVAQLTDEQFQYYPNPADNTLILKTDAKELQTKMFQIMIQDGLGKIVLNEAIDKSITQIDMTHVAAGNYFIVFKSRNGILRFGKITKK